MSDSKIVSIIETGDLTALPEYLRATEPSAMGGGLGTGGRDRIGLKGNRFRLIKGGEEEQVKDENFLDVVVVTANPHVSRIFYKGKFDPDVKTAPTCFSPDGITPFEGVADKQSPKCNGCKQNMVGSATTEHGKKSRACSYSKRLVVVLEGDPDNTLFQIDFKAMSIFGGEAADIKNKLYTLTGYNKLLSTRRVRVDGVVTRISFDTESSVPKLFFTPQGFLSEDRVREIEKLSKSAEAIEMATIDVATTDLEGAESAPPPTVEEPVHQGSHPINGTVPATTTKKATKKAPKSEEVKVTNDDELTSVLAGLNIGVK